MSFRLSSLSLLLLGAVAVVAQPSFAPFQVVVVDGASERAVTALTELGSVASGDAVETRFLVRNTGNSVATLASLSLAGQSFTLAQQFSLPDPIPAGKTAEFRVTFAPTAAGSYSATVTLNGTTFFLHSTAIAAASVTVTGSGPAAVLAPGAPIDFGRVMRNRSNKMQVRIANPGTAALRVGQIAVTGAAFHAPSAPGSVTLQPGGAANFDISFDPVVSGQQSGKMIVDTRTFNLTGVGYDAPIPKPAIEVTGKASSASQLQVAVKLASPTETAGTGTLWLDFVSSAQATKDDPAIVFPGTGSRRLTFSVKEGDTVARFNELSAVNLQTGTTAGTIFLTVDLGDYSEKTPLAISPAPVAVDQAGANRRVSDIDVQLSGFDNTRSAGKFNFTFYDKAGNVVQPGAIPVDATGDFGRYFAISRVGGAFLMRATFPVGGDASQIAGVEVELVNTSGSTRTQRLNVQ